MKSLIKKSILLVATVLFLSPVAVVQAADEPVRLTLADAIKLAVEKNLDVRVELYNPAQYEADLQKSRGIYDPNLSLASTYNSTINPTAANSSTETRTTELNAGLSQLFFTGGTATVGFNNTYFKTDALSSSTGYTSYWQSNAGLTISQPLLKNFGRQATELSIDVAKLSKEASLDRFNAKLTSVVAQLHTEYFKLYSLREALEVKKVSLDLANKILMETTARVKAGVMPAMEILNAQFGVASREKEFIDAERAVKDQLDLLRQMLQLSPMADIQVVDVPSKAIYEVSEPDQISRAIALRPEMQEIRRNLEIAKLQARVSSDKTRPDLVLSASAASTGLGRQYSQDMDRLGSFKYPAWGVGLAFSYPIGNRVAENEYIKNRLKADQLALQVKNQEELIANEVRAAVRLVSAGYKQIEVTDRGRTFAEERLRAFIRKSEVGLATTKDVLDVENDLATAKNNQIQALVGYTNAITQLWKVTGELLEKENIRMVGEYETSLLYKNVK
jgi:outer membrane protein TolC